MEIPAMPWGTISKIKEPEIEITVKVNGKNVDLKEISEKTLLNIREKS